MGIGIAAGGVNGRGSGVKGGQKALRWMAGPCFLLFDIRYITCHIVCMVILVLRNIAYN